VLLFASQVVSSQPQNEGVSEMLIRNESSPKLKAADRIARAGMSFRAPGPLCVICFLLWAIGSHSAQQSSSPQQPLVGPPERIAAQAVFNKNCAGCHQNVKSSADADAVKSRNAPSTETLSQVTPEAIYAALTTGAMIQPKG
jgi:mono/diheme cytochrome c family protein